MNVNYTKVLFSILCLIFMTSCMSLNDPKAQEEQYKNKSNQAFNDYWYSGTAELNSYQLEEARYGQIRAGKAVLIFVTEDFLIHKQVKKESDSKAPQTSVLKLNLLKKFTTGIYDYSLMSSIFSPINQERNVLPIKVTTSSQEWCGHSWLQLNENLQHYQLRGFSYFENEGDLNRLVNKATTEDGLWNQIRINPSKIPQGTISLIPSTQYLRLSHQEIKAYQANIELNTLKDSIKKQILKIEYPELKRKLTIVFKADFPHHILAWTEEKESGGQRLTSKATLISRIKSPYWSENQLKDSTMRKKLKLVDF